MRRRLDELQSTHDQHVTLIGWSLGGIDARMLAREYPDLVRQVITLGSPYRMMADDRSVVSPLWDRVQHLHDANVRIGEISEGARPPLTVPATSIYSRYDGVVRWQLCIDQTGPDAGNPRAENIEVFSLHVGLGFSPAVIFAVLDRLAQPEDDWQPFRPPPMLRPWYPRAGSWTVDHGRVV